LTKRQDRSSARRRKRRTSTPKKGHERGVLLKSQRPSGTTGNKEAARNCRGEISAQERDQKPVQTLGTQAKGGSPKRHRLEKGSTSQQNSKGPNMQAQARKARGESFITRLGKGEGFGKTTKEIAQAGREQNLDECDVLTRK